jgi:hypothetical protein
MVLVRAQVPPMDLRLTVLAVPLLSLFLGSMCQAAVVYTPTNGATCKDLSKDEMGDWICPGPAGYVAHFSDEGNVASVSIGPGPAAGGRDPLQILGSGKVFGEKLQWVVVDGLPRAAVLRLWQRAADDDREVQTLQVFLIERAQTCAFGSFDARRPGANEAALQRTEFAASSDCSRK